MFVDFCCLICKSGFPHCFWSSMLLLSYIIPSLSFPFLLFFLINFLLPIIVFIVLLLLFFTLLGFVLIVIFFFCFCNLFVFVFLLTLFFLPLSILLINYFGFTFFNVMSLMLTVLTVRGTFSYSTGCQKWKVTSSGCSLIRTCIGVGLVKSICILNLPIPALELLIEVVSRYKPYLQIPIRV